MDDQAQESFATLTDRLLPAPVEHAAWCPTMDLLAVACADGRIAVHRLNWQRLWLVTPDAAPTALAWTPSGDALAVGRADGAVCLLDAETGDVVEEGHFDGSGAVTALTWVEEEDIKVDSAAVPQLALQGRARRFCPPPPSAIPCKSTSQGGSAEVNAGWRPMPGKLTLLGIAHESGGIRICTAALLEVTHLTPARLAELGLSRAAAAAGAAAGGSQVAVSRHLSHLLVLRQSEGEQRLEVFSMPALTQARAQLRYQAPLTSEVLACLQSAQQAVAAAGREWGDAAAAATERTEALQGLLRDNMAGGSPEGELRRLLASGGLSPALHQWLTASLGDAGLRRLARQVDGALAAVAQLLGTGVAAAARVVSFQLGDVAGLAHPPCRLPASGLQAAELERARGLAAQLLVRCEQTRMAVMAAAANYRRLFAWLLQCIRRLDEDADTLEPGAPVDVLSLADFLDTQFQHDRIGPELQPQEAGQDRAEGLLGLGGGACELLQLAGLSPTGSDTSLWSLVQELQKAASAGLGGASDALSPAVQPVLALRLAARAPQGPQRLPPARLQLAQLPAEDADGRHAWVAWVGSAGQQGGDAAELHVGVLRVALPPGDATAQEPGVEATAVQLPAGSAAMDTAFYRDGQLALLLAPAQQQGSGAGGSGGTSLALLPLSELTFVAVPAQQHAADILQGCIDNGASVSWEEAGCRQRAVPHADAAPPLAVSGPRGVACVATALPRALLYDLEAEDEGEDEGEGSEGGGHDGDGNESAAMPEDN